MITDLSKWVPRQRPSNETIEGNHVLLEPWNASHHGEALWDAFGGTGTNDLLFHFGWPRMETAKDFGSLLDGFNDSGDFVTCVFVDKASGKAAGMASYMAIVPEHGVVETGAVAHGSALARSRAATEAHYLMARRIFDDLEYRRYEWKLNNPNTASHRAAQRLGFTFEGVFRQHQVKPYGNRDTAWYSMLDYEWPLVRASIEKWLEAENFDVDGRQIADLKQIRAELQQAQEMSDE